MSEEEAIQKAEQLCKKIAQDTQATVSIGLAVFDNAVDSLTLEEILRTVDAAMYQAKKQGKNQVSY